MKKKNAFTLIELLVVISIIALLLSVLMPSLQKAREQAKKVICGSNVRQIALGELLYAQDYKNVLPGGGACGQGVTHGGWNGVARVFGPPILVMLKYIDPKTLYSPSDVRKYKDFEGAWRKLPASNPMPITDEYELRYSYLFREPKSTSFQQVNRYSGSWTEPYKATDKIKSIVAERFANNFSYSCHGSKEEIGVWRANEKGPNGEGWHVGYLGGHVLFKKNDPLVYNYMSRDGASGGWGNRHLNWVYWDQK